MSVFKHKFCGQTGLKYQIVKAFLWIKGFCKSLTVLIHWKEYLCTLNRKVTVATAFRIINKNKSLSCKINLYEVNVLLLKKNNFTKGSIFQWAETNLGCNRNYRMIFVAYIFFIHSKQTEIFVTVKCYWAPFLLAFWRFFFSFQWSHSFSMSRLITQLEGMSGCETRASFS